MSSMVTVRNLPDEDKAWLKRAAERAGRSMEAQLRALIAEARRAELDEEPLAEFLARNFGPENGFELEQPRSGWQPLDLEGTSGDEGSEPDAA